ncbi:Gfo/Idh/MocA family protein [Streptacidiphilus sp. PB12-B1b]|uniref:Gfo/Idh/MocA family protein n=1 Tax=Streptacidiphilus sp. PB12-B1b TaxID=2705012 RepID=UPI0015FBB12D|nr:Gfo/Idh/MocA family oxidoreductase [Streptacidiphilus sp. PB12-B1b]
MRVAVIGLGDIAQKAYLPVLTAEPGLELSLMTRDRAKLDRVGEQYRISRRHPDLDGLLADGVDAAFVHAATSAHVPLVEALLGAGVHAFVDKPLDYSLAGSRKLVEQAEAAGLSLMVGFNRRYAPDHVEALEHPRDLIVLQKNRSIGPEQARPFVFDDFIHVVDTLRFLVPGEVTRTSVRHRAPDGLLHHVVLELSGDGFTALGIMNRLSGSTEEVLELSGRGAKREIVSLSEVVDHSGGRPALRRRGDWVSVGWQRGFVQMCRVFLDAVRQGVTLSGRDALLTHELCEQIVRQVEDGDGAAPTG